MKTQQQNSGWKSWNKNITSSRFCEGGLGLCDTLIDFKNQNHQKGSKMSNKVNSETLAAHTSNAANYAVRGFLKEFSKLTGVINLAEEKNRVLDKTFRGCCAYCDKKIELSDMAWDHIIPHNKEHGGLHIIENLAPSHRSCNAEKAGQDWEIFLAHKNSTASVRLEKLSKRLKTHMNNSASYPDKDALDKLYKHIQAEANSEIRNLLKTHQTKS
jgi:5-methylcytosine-specific restriction endonuclease McrA